MGAAKDFVAATIADALAPSFRRPVEDIIYETLDRRQVPTRTDFKEIRDLINNLRGQVSGTTQGVRKLAEANVETEDILNTVEEKLNHVEVQQKSLEESLKKAQESISQLKARLDARESSAQSNTADLREQIEAILSSRSFSLSKDQDPICKVPGCGEPSRARGFCAKHYQKWRRKTLIGFISLEGTAKFKNKTVDVGERYSGSAYQVSGNEIIVDGESIYKEL